MSTNKAAGPDGITVRLLNDDIDILCPILCNIFNHCLHASAYPCPLKKARVASIYKGGDPTDQSSYRPISVLSALNNLCEKILVARMHKFPDKYDNLPTAARFSFPVLNINRGAVFNTSN